MPASRSTVASARLTPSPVTRPLLLSPHTTLAWEGTETASIKAPAAQSCRSCLIFFCDSIRVGGAPPLTDGYKTVSVPELRLLRETPARLYSGLLRRPHVFNAQQISARRPHGRGTCDDTYEHFKRRARHTPGLPKGLGSAPAGVTRVEGAV